MGVSLNPEHAISGGLLDDVDVEIITARFEIYDYEGKGDPAPVLLLKLKTEDGEEHKEALSVGKIADWQPSDDGKELQAVGNATSLRDKCKAILFLQSCASAGFPPDKLEPGDASVLDGLGFHALRVTVDYRGLEKKRDAQGREMDFTVLNCSKINYLPGEKKGGKGAAAAKSSGTKKKAAPASAPAASGADLDIDSAAEAALLELLIEVDGEIQAKMIPTKIYKKLTDVKNKNLVLKRSYEEDFLSGERPWTYEDGVVKLA